MFLLITFYPYSNMLHISEDKCLFSYFLQKYSINNSKNKVLQSAIIITYLKNHLQFFEVFLFFI